MADYRAATQVPKKEKKGSKRWKDAWDLMALEHGTGDEPPVIPYFGCQPYGSHRTCKDIHPHGPIPEGDRIYCPVCHQTGFEKHRKVVLAKSDIPPPEPKVAEPPKPKKTRKQKRAEAEMLAKLVREQKRDAKADKPAPRPYSEIRAERFAEALATSRGVKA